MMFSNGRILETLEGFESSHPYRKFFERGGEGDINNCLTNRNMLIEKECKVTTLHSFSINILFRGKMCAKRGNFKNDKFNVVKIN